MKYLALILFMSCAHQSKNSEKCGMEVPLELAQCFLDEKQPLRALTLSEEYLKKNENFTEWTMISFESYLALGNERRAVNSIQKGIQAAPHMSYYETLVKHFEKKDQAKALEWVNAGLIYFPENSFLKNKKTEYTQKDS